MTGVDGKERRSAIFFLLVFLGLLGGCSLPRIIVLDDPLTPEEHLNLGVAYEKRGELDAALKEYELSAPHLPLASVYRGNVYFAKGEIGRAEESYQQALEKDPNNADACNNLAWLYYGEGKKLEEAERLARRALELNPAKAAIYRDTLEKIEIKRNVPASP